MTDFLTVTLNRRLILEFELRTKEESGLVLYMARINHADFVSIQVSVHSWVSVCTPQLCTVYLSLLLLCRPADQGGTGVSGLRPRSWKHLWLRSFLHQRRKLAQGRRSCGFCFYSVYKPSNQEVILVNDDKEQIGGAWRRGGVMFVLTLVVSSSPQIRVSRNKQRCLLMVDGRYSKQMISPKKVDEWKLHKCTLVQCEVEFLDGKGSQLLVPGPV